MIKTRFSRWLTFLRSPLPWRWRYRQKPTPGRCRQRAVVWLAKTNFMWWKMTVVLWKPSPKKYNVGFLALLQANPGVDPYVPRAGSVLTIPLQTLLPDAPREGIVINIAELRLYYYPPGKNSVTVYPIGIGQLGGDTLTPTMVTTVSDKRKPNLDANGKHPRPL